MNVKLINNTNQWYHNFWLRIKSFLLQLNSRTEDSLGLHCSNLWECITQTATTKTQHWVALRKCTYTTLNKLNTYAHLFSHYFLSLKVVWNELMQRRIEQANVYRLTIHTLQDAIEILLLIRQKLFECLFTLFRTVSENHLTHSLNLLILEEHVLCTAEANTNSTEITCYFCIMWGICVGTNNQLTILLTKVHQLCEVTCNLSRASLHLTKINFTC